MELDINDEEILDALREEYNELKMQDRTFVLDNKKAILAKNICTQLKSILDRNKATYTIDVQKTMVTTTDLSIIVMTNRFNPLKNYMQVYRDILNEVCEVSFHIKDSQIEIEFFIEDAYIQLD